MKNVYFGGENSFQVLQCWALPLGEALLGKEGPRLLVMNNTSYSSKSDFPFLSQMGIRVTSPTWVESVVQILQGETERKIELSIREFPGEKKIAAKQPWGGRALHTAPCPLKLDIFWGMRAATCSSIIRKLRSEGTSLVCPTLCRDSVTARLGCSGLCPAKFGRSQGWRHSIFIALLALKKKRKTKQHHLYCTNNIYGNDVSGPLSLILSNEISSTCKFNCEMIII